MVKGTLWGHGDLVEQWGQHFMAVETLSMGTPVWTPEPHHVAVGTPSIPSLQDPIM